MTDKIKLNYTQSKRRKTIRMAFKTEWINDPYIIGTHFEGQVTVDEVKMAMLEYLGAAQEQKAVYVLMDFSNVDNVPNRLLDLPILLQVITHANVKWIAIVKEDNPNSYMTQFLSRDKLKMFRNRESAIAFLNGMVRLDTGENLEAGSGA